MGMSGSKASAARKRKAAAASQVTDKDRAVLDLKNARDRLQRVRHKVEGDAHRLRVAAANHLRKGDKKKAGLCMKLRKGKMKRLEGVEGQLLNIYELTQSIEFQSEQVGIFNALREGKDALKRLNEEMTAESVIQLMDEISDSDRCL